MEENNTEIPTIKIGLFGDSNVGKSAICDTFFGFEFRENNFSSIGIVKMEKMIELENGKEIKLISLDTPGRERFRSLVFQTIKAVQGIILVFDATSKKSFDNINMWLDVIKHNCTDSALILLGNKTDIEIDKWQVTKKEINNFTKKTNLVCYAVSAKKKEGINESFNYLTKIINNKIVIQKESKEKFSKETGKNRLKDELNFNKIDFEILRKDYDILKKNYDTLKKNNDTLKKNIDKLKDDNAKLNIELNKAKCIISNFEDGSKERLKEIDNLKTIILQKEDEILNLKLKIKNLESFSKTSFNNDDIISVQFISSDQNINCPLKCLKNDTFAEVEEKLYQKYQEYREINNKFLLKGKSVMRFKKIIENNITDGDKIELIKMD